MAHRLVAACKHFLEKYCTCGMEIFPTAREPFKITGRSWKKVLGSRRRKRVSLGLSETFPYLENPKPIASVSNCAAIVFSAQYSRENSCLVFSTHTTSGYSAGGHNEARDPSRGSASSPRVSESNRQGAGPGALLAGYCFVASILRAGSIQLRHDHHVLQCNDKKSR